MARDYLEHVRHQRQLAIAHATEARDLLDEHHTSIGVLQVLDKRGSPTFSLQDMELLGVFARQATEAIGAARVQRDTVRLLTAVLRQVGPDLDDEQVERLVSAAVDELESDPEAPFWRMVDQVTRLRGMSDRELALVSDMLEVVAKHAARSTRRR